MMGKKLIAPTLPTAHAGLCPSWRAAMHVSTPLSNDEAAANRVELYRRAADNSEHPPFGLRPVLTTIKSDAMNGSNHVVINRAKRRNQRGDFCEAGVFVSPWAARVIAKR